MGKTRFLLTGIDGLLAFAVLYLGFVLAGAAHANSHGTVGIKALLITLLLLLTASFAELYGRNPVFSRRDVLARVFGSLVLAGMVLWGAGRLFPEMQWSWQTLAPTLLLFGVLQFFWHVRYMGILRNSVAAQRTLIIGTGHLAQKLKSALDETSNNHLLEGFVQPEAESSLPGLRVLGTVDQLESLVDRFRIGKIVVALSERRGVLPVREILACKLEGVRVVDGLNFYEELTGKLMIEGINPSWLIFSDGFCVTAFMRLHKRFFDLFWALFGLILSLPLFPILALLIKLDSPGPVFFLQARVGKRERLFNVIKFRTMRQDAEKHSGAVWAQKNDPRVTMLGGLLRKTRLDEIPQLINVLRGEMSFIGPRPERPEFVQELNKKIPYYAKRHFVKPGITGWAQVKYPYGASEEDALEKLRYDLYYIKNYSIWLDFTIVSETVKVVLFGRGGR